MIGFEGFVEDRTCTDPRCAIVRVPRSYQNAGLRMYGQDLGKHVSCALIAPGQVDKNEGDV